MKHLKRYKIFESASSELNDEIIDVLANATDYGYNVKIYDYYQEKESNNLFNNNGSVTPTTNKIKLVKVSANKSKSDFFNIDDFSELGFNSSGFTFTSGDTNQLRDFYFELFDSMSHFSDYDPKISMSNDYVMIILNTGLVNDDDVNSGDKLKNMYSFLNSSFTKLIEEIPKFKSLGIRYYESVFKIKLKNDEMMSKVLASLCTQMSDIPNYSWMNDEPKISEITSIRDKINNDGFNVSFKSDDDYVKLIITKK